MDSALVDCKFADTVVSVHLAHTSLASGLVIKMLLWEKNESSDFRESRCLPGFFLQYYCAAFNEI